MDAGRPTRTRLGAPARFEPAELGRSASAMVSAVGGDRTNVDRVPAEVIGAAALQQSYVGHDESAPPAHCVPALTDALVIHRRPPTRVELLDSTTVPGARISTERPDRLGPG